MQHFQGKKAAFTNMLCLDGSDGGVKEDKSLVLGGDKIAFRDKPAGEESG